MSYTMPLYATQQSAWVLCALNTSFVMLPAVPVVPTVGASVPKGAVDVLDSGDAGTAAVSVGAGDGVGVSLSGAFAVCA